MKKRKTAAWLLTGAMAVTMCAPAAVQAQGVEGIDNTLLAEFDFNTPASDGVISGTGAKAKVNGSIQLQDRIDGDTALYLDGSSGTYLDVTASDGSSLLTGKDEITISFDTKRARSNTSWIFFAAPDAGEQTYNSEHYLACYSAADPGIRVERYNNSGARSEAITGSAGENWVHVDILVSAENTQLYIDGKSVSTVGSEYTLSDILGDESIFYIGKANWTANGEYANCWVDNFRIYDGLLDENEITAQYNVFADEMLWDGVSLPKDPIAEDLDLPETNAAGDNVTWISGNTNIIGADGKLVSQPENDTEVTMTADRKSVV